MGLGRLFAIRGSVGNSSLFRFFFVRAVAVRRLGCLCPFLFPVDEWPMLIRLFMLLTRYLFSGGFRVHSTKFVEFFFFLLVVFFGFFFASLIQFRFSP